MILDPSRQPPAAQSSAEAILWQGKVRLAVALVTGAAALLLPPPGVLHGAPSLLLACAGAYLAVVGTIYVAARRVRTIGPPVIGLLLLGDLALVFGATVLTSRPVYYDRSLIVSFFILHLAEFYFGRAYAYFVGAVVTGGYLALIDASIRRGAPLHWGEELWSAAAFVAAAALVIHEYGGLRRRVGTIVTLLERVGGGDFSEEYDVHADRPPDAITAVGRAYNGVRAQLQSMVLSDALTGCLNRRGFDQALGREIARSTRAGGEFALLAIDLDHFKRLNDRCGHMAGDAILRELGALLRQSARAGDVVARTGGEEFTLILPDTDAAGAFQLATRLTERIRSRTFVVGGRSLTITVSVGVAAAAGSAIDPQGQELKLRADQALYAAKRLGRDRVLTWTA